MNKTPSEESEFRVAVASHWPSVVAPHWLGSCWARRDPSFPGRGDDVSFFLPKLSTRASGRHLRENSPLSKVFLYCVQPYTRPTVSIIVLTVNDNHSK